MCQALPHLHLDDDVRKFPETPKNPEKRMKKLIQFSQNLFSDQFSSWSRAEKFAKNFQRIGDQMLDKYKTCGAGKSKRESGDEPSDSKERGQGKVARTDFISICLNIYKSTFTLIFMSSPTRREPITVEYFHEFSSLIGCRRE